MEGNYHQVTDDHSKEACCDRIKVLEGKWHVYWEQPEPEFVGTWSMLKLWWKWMGQTAEFMHNNGVRMPHYVDSQGNNHGERFFKADDAHELFTARWMGTDKHGRRLSWSISKNDSHRVQAPKSKRLYAMEKHQAWAVEKGINLANPEDSEFRKLQMEQEK